MDTEKMTSSIKIRTPEYEHPLIYRDLVAAALSQWADIVSIDNVQDSEIIEISRIPKEEVAKVRKIISCVGVEIIIEN